MKLSFLHYTLAFSLFGRFHSTCLKKIVLIILNGVGVVQHTDAEHTGILGAFPAAVVGPGVSVSAGDILFPSLRGLPRPPTKHSESLMTSRKRGKTVINCGYTCHLLPPKNALAPEFKFSHPKHLTLAFPFF